jgi:tetratricopeptide (TPR) repeat protein
MEFSTSKTMTYQSKLSLSLTLGLLFTATPMLTLAEATAVMAQTQSVPSEIRQGYVLLGKGWVNDAIAVFQQAIQRYPDSLEAKLGLAIAYRRAGRDVDAWQAYQQVLQQDPNNTLALKTVGTLAGFRPVWQTRGIEALTTLLSAVPNDNEARSQRALLYGYQGRFTEALADYEIVLKGNVAPDVLLNAAQIYTYAGDTQRGLALFEQYQSRSQVAISGNAAIAYARALRAGGNTAQAIRVLESQLVQGDNVQARSELSQAYLTNQQPVQALAVLDPLRDRAEARLPLARALNEIGKQENRPDLTAQSASLYKQVLSEIANPQTSLVREVADVLSGIPAERQNARQLYRQLVAQDPENRILVIQQLSLESQLGSMPRSEIRQRLRTILQPLPTEPAQQFALAQALVRLEAETEFLPVYQTLIRAGVNEPFLQFRLAQLLIEQNEIEAAKTAIATYQATPLGRRDRATELLLAEIDRRQGNLAGAATRYEQLITGNSSTEIQAGAIRGLAGVRVAQGRYADALALYDQLVARNPGDAQLQLGRTAVAYQAKKISLREAEATLDRFLQTRPSESPAELYSLVSVLPTSASREALYEALAAADPNNVPIQVKLIQLIASRNPTAARAKANQLMARIRQASPNDSGNISLLLLRAQLEQTLGNLNRAEDAYQTILKLQPENLDALAGLGGVKFQKRDLRAADALYNQVLEINPDSLTARRSLAELSVAQGRPLDALTQFEQMLIQQGGNDPEMAQRIQKLHEDLLRQRGFQPPWERY